MKTALTVTANMRTGVGIQAEIKTMVWILFAQVLFCIRSELATSKIGNKFAEKVIRCISDVEIFA